MPNGYFARESEKIMYFKDKKMLTRPARIKMHKKKEKT